MKLFILTKIQSNCLFEHSITSSGIDSVLINDMNLPVDPLQLEWIKKFGNLSHEKVSSFILTVKDLKNNTIRDTLKVQYNNLPSIN